MKQSALLEALSEIEPSLALSVRESLRDKEIAATIRERLSGTIRNLAEAMESGERRRINRAIASVRMFIHERTPGDQRPLQMNERVRFPNREYLLAFERGAKSRLEDMDRYDAARVTFTVGGVKMERSPYRLFGAIARQVPGKESLSMGQQLCIYLRDGKSPEEAKKLVETAQQAGEVNCAYLLAFEKGAGRRLEKIKAEDRIQIAFTVGSTEMRRSPNALFFAVSRRYLTKVSPSMGRQFCIHLRDGKSPEEAKKLAEAAKQAGEMNCAYLLAFEQGAKRRLEDMDRYDDARVTFTVGGVKMERSPRMLFDSVSLKILGGRSLKRSQQFCIHLRDGKSIEEAKKLVEQFDRAHEVNQTYLHAFEHGAKRRLED